jgi:hypothetical protein
MDQDEQRALAREIATAQRKEKERQLGVGCLAVIVVAALVWVGMQWLAAVGRQ